MKCDLENMIKGGKIHKKIEEYIKTIIQPEIKLYDLAIQIENKINELTNYEKQNPLNSGVAFPTGLSINNCAAHWTPKINNIRKLKKTDVIKIDYGVHIEGSIIDAAFTYSFDEKYKNLLDASRTSTDLAIKLARPDMLLTEIGKEIEENMCSYEIEIDNKIYKIKPVRTLCGHEINKYEIHGNKLIPNIYMKDYNERIDSEEFFAVETFATTGNGLTYEDNEDCSHFMINYNKKFDKKDIISNSKGFYKLINKYYNTLAFCDRWIIGKMLGTIKLDNNKINKYINNLEKTGVINKYPPIYDLDKDSYIAQFEETIYINEKKTEILSKLN
jgi:methionyl aminopeptidase